MSHCVALQSIRHVDTYKKKKNTLYAEVVWINFALNVNLISFQLFPINSGPRGLFLINLLGNCVKEIFTTAPAKKAVCYEIYLHDMKRFVWRALRIFKNLFFIYDLKVNPMLFYNLLGDDNI